MEKVKIKKKKKMKETNSIKTEILSHWFFVLKLWRLLWGVTQPYQSLVYKMQSINNFGQLTYCWP